MALSEFQKAFKSARSSGDKEFEFEGKKYNTKYKEEDSAPAKKAAPAKETYESPSQDASKSMGSAVGSQKKQPPKKEGGIGPYNVGAGPSDEEKATTYDKYAENRKKMGDSGDNDSGSKPIAESDWAKSVRSSQSGDTGFLSKKMREAMGSSYKKGGSVSASRRADGIAQRGKTRGKMC
jgi:hypothetical protein